MKVEAELARREQQQQDSLGPADLDSLLSRARVPVSRGGVGQSEPVRTPAVGQSPSRTAAVGQSPSRGRLQVLDNVRPDLQPQDDLQGQFEQTLNTFRQRNRG